jgi:hypothetical protein
MKHLMAFLFLAGVALAVGGCASPNVNPATARRGMGYVDFYADDADNLFWIVTDLKTNRKLYNVFDPLNEPILRLELKPGQYQLQVTFANHIIDAPGTVEVEVHEGMITPVTVTLLPSGEAMFKTKSTGWGSTYFGIYGRRTTITEHPSTSYEVGLDPRDPLPYQPKAQMPYYQRPAE